MALLFLTTGFLPVAAQTVKELEEGLASCQKNRDSLNQQMQGPCNAESAVRQTCEDTRAWLDNLKRLRANNPTSYQDPTLQARAETEKKIVEKQKECSSKSANVWGYCEYQREESIKHKLPALYSPEACARARREYEQCQNEFYALEPESIRVAMALSRDPVKKQAAELDDRINEHEKEYSSCLETLEVKGDECRRLLGQYTSVTIACDDIKLKLEAARKGGQSPTSQSSGQGSTVGSVKLAPVGRVEDKADSPVTMKATVEVRGQVPAGTQYGYYWYVNKVSRTYGMNMTSYSFKVPNVA